MSNFEKDDSLTYLKQGSRNRDSFYSKMERQQQQQQDLQQQQDTSANNNDNNNKKPLKLVMSALFNYSPPSLPRSYLPSPEYTQSIHDNFATLRNQVLVVRMELSNLSATENQQVKLQQQNTKRRQRNEVETGNDDDDQNTIVAVNLARKIFRKKYSANLFDASAPVVPHIKNFDRRKWMEFIFNPQVCKLFSEQEDLLIVLGSEACMYSPTRFSLIPVASISLLARLTPGQASILVEAICTKFSKIANGKESILYRCSKSEEPPLEIVAEVVEDLKGVPPPQQAPVSSSPSATPRMGPRSASNSSNGKQLPSKIQVECLLRFIALLRHSGLGCWLYSALCGLELPLSVEVNRCLQEILRICCQSLQTLLDIRPDLVTVKDESFNVVGLGTGNGEDDVEYFAHFKISVAQNAEDGAAEQKKSKTEVKIVICDVNFLKAQDVRALMTLIVILGKYFKLSNPALLQL